MSSIMKYILIGVDNFLVSKSCRKSHWQWENSTRENAKPAQISRLWNN